MGLTKVQATDQGNTNLEVNERFKFKDETQRFIRANFLNYCAISILLGVCILYSVLRFLFKETENLFDSLSSVIGLFMFFVILTGSYLRFGKEKKFRLISAIITVISYLLISYMPGVTFIHWVLAGALAISFPYYDVRYTRRLSIVYSIIFFGNVIYRDFQGDLSNRSANGITQIVIILCIMFALFMACRLGRKFNDHMLGFINCQKEEQEQLVSDILEISKTVKSETDKGHTSVLELFDATETVHHSMEEISAATENTAENVQEQSIKTQEIQQAIEATVEQSRAMVSVAQESNVSIKENITAVEELKKQSANIAHTNAQVTDSMQKLQQKTKEVEEIAEMIFSISNKTNLLALNASIESARAGEAGRGFAVVAEQIRQLAEQTRISTENIGKIIGELNSNAVEVVDAVGESIEATQKQNEMILTTAGNMEKLDNNIDHLIGGIHDIDTEISGLYDSNNKIVESISQLSATAEEITATAVQARELTDKNLELAQATKVSLVTIKSSSEGMEKYF